MDKVVFQSNVQGHGQDFENVGAFHTRCRLPEYFPSLRGTIPEGETSLPTEEVELRAIEALQGVTEIRVSRHCEGGNYALVVHKGGAFTWDELNPQIIELLQQRYERLFEEAIKK